MSGWMVGIQAVALVVQGCALRWQVRSLRRIKDITEPRISFLINGRVALGPMTPTQFEEMRRYGGEDGPAIGWLGPDVLDLRIER